MVDLAPGSHVSVENPNININTSAPGKVNNVWLKEGPPGPPGRNVTSVVRTAGTGAPGTLDTYTISYSDGTTTTFTVYNGTNGSGDVNGPASAVDNRVAVFNGTTGKAIKDSGVILGTAASKDTGTAAGTVAAGDDSRITGAAQKSANLSDLANPATARTNLGLGTAATVNTGTASGNIPVLNASGRVDTARLGSGTASASTYLRGDGSWAAASGAGAGTILASKVHNPGTITTYSTTSTTHAAMDTTNLAVTFAAPASGAVRVRLSAPAASEQQVYWGLLLSGSLIAEAIVRADSTSYETSVAIFPITGLTPGASYTYQWAHKVGASGMAYTAPGGVLGAAIMEVVQA